MSGSGIDKDQYGNPYYHSNFRSLDISTGRRYTYPTNIGGEEGPVKNFDAAYSQIIYDDVTSGSLWKRKKDSQQHLCTANVHINENVFVGGKSLITADKLTRFVLVGTR